MAPHGRPSPATINGWPLLRFVAASDLTNLVDGVAATAWAWTASLLTRDPLPIALVAMALRLPWARFAIPAGIITGRADRRRLMLGMDGLRLSAGGRGALVGVAAGKRAAGWGLLVPPSAALILAGIAGNFRPRQADRKTWRGKLAEAMAFLHGVPIPGPLAWLTGFWNLFFQTVTISLIPHVHWPR
ncbi:hypothetical protein VB636_07515 [Paracoccus sp. APAP_BH8]|uniref:hypothetical protein n=1 Tax=Paracoccus sp. APAP_BH8 TaxID=3110237 RepID=UPI002FD7B71E